MKNINNIVILLFILSIAGLYFSTAKTVPVEEWNKTFIGDLDSDTETYSINYAPNFSYVKFSNNETSGLSPWSKTKTFIGYDNIINSVQQTKGGYILRNRGSTFNWAISFLHKL